MASGRLGSISLSANRAGIVYDNNSGGAVSLSVMAKVKSSTSNIAISLWIDPSSTAAETISQVSSTSFTKVVDFLSLNSGNTAVELRHEKGTGTGSSYFTPTNYVDSSGTVGGDIWSNMTPSLFDEDITTWTGWNGPEGWYTSGTNDISTYYVYTKASLLTNKVAYFKKAINYAQATTGAGNKGSMSYSNYGITYDPYCSMQPVFGINSSSYMSMMAVNSGGGLFANNRTSNGSYYSYVSNGSSNPGVNWYTPRVRANGGMIFMSAGHINYVMFSFYGRTPATTNSLEQVIEDNGTSTGTGYPLIFRFQTDAFSGVFASTKNDWFKFLEHNPTTLKTYWLGNFSGEGMKFLEFDTVLAEAWLSANQASGTAPFGTSFKTLSDLIGTGFVTDLTSLSTTPAIFKSKSDWTSSRNVRRVGTNRWRYDIYDKTTSTYTAFETKNLRDDWTVVDLTSNFEALYPDGSTLQATGSVTNRIVNNTPTLADSGLLEYNTQVNQYERTGLVLSDGDRVVVSNNGTDIVGVQAMGYEA